MSRFTFSQNYPGRTTSIGTKRSSGGSGGNGPSLGPSKGPAGSVKSAPESEDFYPLEDPGKALRNFLRQQGMYGNPFSPALQRYTSRTAAGLAPGFYAHALKQGAPSTGTSADMFRDFISDYVSGRNRPTYAQTQQNVGDVNAALRNIGQAAAGMQGIDWTNPNDVAKARGMMEGGQVAGVDPWQAGILGNLLSPDDQAKFFLGSYLPTLGPALSSGLGKVMQPQQESFEDYLDALSNIGTGGFRSLLDLLSGSMGIGKL